MKRQCLFGVLAVMLAATPLLAEEKVFTIDPVHSTVTFRIRHLYSMFTGRINKFSGTIWGDVEKPESFRVEAVVDVGSIDTANDGRDKHLRTADFFNAPKFSESKFTSTKTVVRGENRADVTGAFELLGKSVPVTFAVEFLGYGSDGRKGKKAGFHAVATIKRSDFGMGYNFTFPNGLTMLGDEVELILEIEAIETAVPEPKSLAQQIEEFKAQHKKPRPREVVEAMAKANKEIMAQGNIEGLAIGARAPNFVLRDAKGVKHKLSKALKQGPVVLVFYRGEWCPFCNLQLRALEDAHLEMKTLGASLIAVTPQRFGATYEAGTKNRLSFPLLSDANSKTMRKYKLFYTVPDGLRNIYQNKYNIDLEKHNGEGRWELPVTATYILDSKGIVRARMVDLDYTKRMEPTDILKALRAL